MSIENNPFPITNLIQMAQREIFRRYGHITTVGRDSSRRFGRNRDVDATEVTLWSLDQDETYVSDNLIDSISSSNSGDAQEIVIEGHTIDPVEGFTEVRQVVQLNGQNRVALETPLARSDFAVNAGSTPLSGNVYVYENGPITGGIPDDLATVHNYIAQTDNQSAKAALTVPKGSYFVIIKVWAFVNRANNGSANINFYGRPFGGVFSLGGVGAVSDGAGFELDLEPYSVIEPNTDIKLTADSGQNNMDVSGGVMGFFADIVDGKATLGENGYEMNK